MTTAEERMRILEMIREGKVSAEEGASLLEALNRSKPATPPPPTRDPRVLRVRITDTHSQKTKVHVNIPMSLVNVGIKLGARFTPANVDMDSGEIMEAIQSGTSGKIFDVEDMESGEHIEIWVE
ncbi:MAG: hypothetical protein JXQ72_11195 [Anaerolineae bacterium]|nr:hypothetical protein [Anaerolineae bacterium]